MPPATLSNFAMMFEDGSGVGDGVQLSISVCTLVGISPTPCAQEHTSAPRLLLNWRLGESATSEDHQTQKKISRHKEVMRKNVSW